MTDLRELHADLRRIREEHGMASSKGAEAYNRLSAEAWRQGVPLDGLRRYTTDEHERFLSFTINGLDGHVYWDGPRYFRRNDHHDRKPIRWWWEHAYGPIPTYQDVKPTCGEPNCINVIHAGLADRRTARLRFTDEQMLGALQVMAMRLGRSPRPVDWRNLNGRPVELVYRDRFGGWDRAIRSAGLPDADMPHNVKASASRSITALRVARKVLGQWPTAETFKSPPVRGELQRLHLPSSSNTIYAHLGGSWPECLRKAGKR
jgi:Homing endonuclease associated repeat